MIALGKVIDVEFRPTDRGRWCVRCDEPFPEGTALCPRCGGELASAARHRAAMQAAARRATRRILAAAAGVLVVLAAIVVLLVLGVGHARGDEKARVEHKKERTTTVAAARPTAAAGVTGDAVEAQPGPRPVRVRLLDGSTVVGTVHAEEAQALVIDCSLGLLSIPRARISTIAYDAAAGVGQKRAPVQQLDDDSPPRKQSSRP